MTIRVTCEACGKTLKAPDTAAGKRSKCPSCGHVIEIPDVVDAEEVPADSGGYDEGYDDYDDGGYEDDYEEADDRRPCPACGEMIKRGAAKCRYCGEVFDPALKKKLKGRSSGSRGGGGDDENLSAGEYVVAVLCSGIGCIVGIVWMIQGKPKGIKMFGISLLMQFFWGAVRVFIEMANN